MKRRRFIKTLAASPALAIPAAQTALAQQPTATTPPRPVTEPVKLEFSGPDAVAETKLHFFTPQQFASLRSLSDLLMPALNGSPGALDAKAAEFLDFLLSVSPVERQQIYRSGLDALNALAIRQFQKSFTALNTTQASTLLSPLRQPWTYEPPADPLARFLREAKQDVRTATLNSPEWGNAGNASGRRMSGMGQYWYPLD